MNVNLHIERLILDGLPVEAGQGALLQAAIEAELTRLLSESGVAPSLQAGGAMPSVRADAIQLAAESNPAQLGRQIANSVHGSISKAR